MPSRYKPRAAGRGPRIQLRAKPTLRRATTFRERTQAQGQRRASQGRLERATMMGLKANQAMRGNPSPRPSGSGSGLRGNPFTFPGNPGSLVIASAERIRNAVKNHR